MRLLFTAVLVIAAAFPQTRRMLFLSHSAGFRHGSIPTARETLERIGARNGIAVTASEDVSFLRPENLSQFDAVFFFTSGELPIDGAQRAALLDFVRSGKGFGGAHSASDTLYTWPEYGELIGGYFDGHPWTHAARVEVEDPAHPATRTLPVSFTLLEEFYQHRAFDRSRVRVLMTLDTRTVDLRAPGVNRTDEDFALAWCRPYGAGRVFYTALGHFDETWRDARVETMLEGAVRYLAGIEEGDCSPRPAPQPRIKGIARIAPGGVYELLGEELTAGATMFANPAHWSTRLAGVSVRIAGEVAPLAYAAPQQINFRAPWDLRLGDAVEIAVTVGNQRLASTPARVVEALPRILAVTQSPGALTVWVTGLGALYPGTPLGEPSIFSVLSPTAAPVAARLDGAEAPVLFAGAAPGTVGLYQVNVAAAALAPGEHEVEIRAAGEAARFAFRTP
ncbi:MAG: ThuA domain-containing protein [Bryobacteraceae bacterium]